jgi:hypothetical protein
MYTQAQIQRFKEKFQVDENGCWIWKAAVGGAKSPRPQIRINGTCLYATRVAWEIYKGDLPAGFLVLHDCDNNLCVNPKHLWLGTQKQNMRDASSKGRLGKATINESIANWIRRLRQQGKTIGQIATETGIAAGTVSNVLSGQRWA